MSEVTVVVATECDDEIYDAICRLLPQLSSSAAPSRQQVELAISEPGTHLLLAILERELVGMLTLVIVRTLTGTAAHVEDVVVDDKARGRGVGEALVLRAFAVARDRGVQHVDLTSRPSREAANRLYQRLGFELRETNAYRYRVGR
ncbi:MAG TPA: GNAT family N-acetyltransferase [Mycobacteriales bacterium]|nr:GNAT family N-acetyltransferase [Mycobacteriales bacterium]